MSTASEDHDFVGYMSTKKDPGWVFTIGVILFCIFLNMMVPVWMRILRREKVETEVTTPRTATSDIQSERGKIVGLSKERPPKSSMGTLTAHQIALASGEHSSKAGAASSVVSQAYTSISMQSRASSTVFSQAATAILNVRPAKSSKMRRVAKRNRTGNEALQRRIATQVRQPTANDDNLDTASVGGGSVMSVLDHDAVSVKDAVDAHEAMLLEKAMPPSSLWTQFLEIADWDEESKRLVALTIPYTINGFSEAIFSLVQVALIGHFMGVMEANVYIIVSLLCEITGTITYGFYESLGVLIPQAQGANNDKLVGSYLQMAIILYTIFSIPSIIVWALFTEEAVLWFGFDEETAALSQRFVFPWLWMYLFEGLEDCLSGFLETTGHERYSTYLSVFYSVFETLVILMMLTWWGMEDIVYIAIVQAFLGLLFTLGNLAYTIRRGWLNECWKGLFETFSLKDRRAVKTMMITAVPYSVSWILTYGEWEVLTLFASAMGPAEVAAWGLLGYIWDVFEEITEGLASACEVRVGFHMGAGMPHSAKIVAYKTVYMGVVLAVFAASLMFILCGYIPGWLTPDPTLQRIIFDLLPLVGFGQILLVVGTVLWGVVGAQGRVQLATLIEFAASWFVVVPLSALAAYVLDFNLMGLVGALVLSYCFAGNIMSLIVLKSDWNKQSQIVIMRNVEAGKTWEDNEWEELPAAIQQACVALGYNKNTWNSGQEPPVNELSWKELSPAQQVAARTLGYQKKTWNCSDDLEDCDWSELPNDAKEAALFLGYNEKMWDADEEPDIARKDWQDLTPEQKQAATVMGFNEERWDKDDDSGSESADEKTFKSTTYSSSEGPASSVGPGGDYEDLDWEDLPVDVQAAARLLGYNEELWDNDECPSSESKSWKELTKAQQNAAKKIGFNEDKWDNDESS